MKEIKYLNKIKEFLYLFYLYIFGILLPFFFDNFYFNMLEAKADIAYLFLKILFILILQFASSTASSTISIPITFFT